jgi:hypothetical protein
LFLISGFMTCFSWMKTFYGLGSLNFANVLSTDTVPHVLHGPFWMVSS